MTRSNTIVLFAALLFAFTLLPGDCIARTWTDRQGRRVEADLVGVNNGTVTIKRKSDGRVFQLPLDKLSDRDQAFVNSQTAREEAAADDLFPCTLQVAETDIQAAKLLVSLDLIWKKSPNDITKEDVTIVVLFQPQLLAPLQRELLALSRDYVFKPFASKDFVSMESAISIKDNHGKSHEGALLLFQVQADSKLNLTKTGRIVIRIPVQKGSRTTGQPTIQATGVFSFAVFQETDPDVDIIKSTTYKQLSPVATKTVTLGE